MPPFLVSYSSEKTSCNSTDSMPSMETMQQISNESFSFSWLTGAKPSFEINSDSMCDICDFDFGLPGSNSPVLVHADEIFSNGLLLPLCVSDQSRSESTSESESESTLSRSLSLGSSESYISLSNRFQSCCSCNATSRLASSDFSRFDSVSDDPRRSKPKVPSLRKYAKKYLSFFLPWGRKVRVLRSITSKAERISPSTESEFSSIEKFSYESAIHEAILHCKNSTVTPV